MVNKCLMIVDFAYLSQLVKCVNYVLLQHIAAPGNM